MKKIPVALTMFEMIVIVLSSIFFVVSLVLSIIIIAMAKQTKVSAFAGITWLFITLSWLGRFISGLALVVGIYMPIQSIILLQLPFFAFSIIPWTFTFTEFKFQDNRKLILILISIFVVSFLIPVFLFLIINPSWVGLLTSPIDIHYRPYVIGYLLHFRLFFLVTAILLFVSVFIPAEDKEIRIKGVLLFVSFLLFTISFIIDILLSPNILILTSIYGLLITSAILYFLSFNIPYEIISSTPKSSY